jgi:DNA invertase Pin-like site-specific DNA recombinase
LGQKRNEAGSEKVSGAKRERNKFNRMLASHNAGNVVLVTRLDRLSRSTRDLFNILGVIANKGAADRSFGDGWAKAFSP